MSLFQKLEARRTGARRGSEMDLPLLTDFIPTGRTKNIAGAISISDEYLLGGHIGINFWANPAQFDSELQMAHETLRYRLYGDVLKELAELRQAVSDGDRSKALKISDAMKKLMLGVQS